jgi:hypothetical protein
LNNQNGEGARVYWLSALSVVLFFRGNLFSRKVFHFVAFAILMLKRFVELMV